MEALFNYGITQEDALTDCKALGLEDGDSLLCIASAGEIPLNIGAIRNVRITAVDIAPSQLRLCRIKKAAALNCEPDNAASFLGFMDMESADRILLFNKSILPALPENDLEYWKANLNAVKDGVINSGRFEMFMKKVSGFGRSVVGRKHLYRLFECESVEEQQEIFDRKINGLVVKGIFHTAFHPWIYKNRGIDPLGLTHSGARNIGEFFSNRFRNFCCATPSRKNYYLQFTFFGKILFREAFPEFLQHKYRDQFYLTSSRMIFRETSIQDALSESPDGTYNRVHISNIGDWMSEEAMAGLFRLIRDKTKPGARIVMRYIHLRHKIPDDVPELVADPNLGYDLESHDRYPFYSIIPIIRI